MDTRYPIRELLVGAFTLMVVVSFAAMVLSR